ncbi:hypothetical protein JXQ31_13085 [candidate division KSB1 bacterium]|nr:hypothetical protein [candidate division KSB1 bacterium]
MESKILFTIPIYYRSFEEHGKEYDKRFKDFKQRKKKTWGELFDKEYKSQLKLDLEFQNYWYSWSYTQIIKYVEIHLEHNILKAYLHSVEAKRFRAIMNRKIFKYVGKVADVAYLKPYYNDEEIREQIYNFINELRSSYKRYYVDSSQVENLLPYIDFTKLKLEISKEIQKILNLSKESH